MYSPRPRLSHSSPSPYLEIISACDMLMFLFSTLCRPTSIKMALTDLFS